MSSLPDPEVIASDLLNRAMQVAAPVDLDTIASLWKDLHISVEPLGREGYLVDLGTQGGELLLNSEDPPTRRRYTMAHELGHWMLKQLTGVSRQHRNSAPDQVSERWCNKFASALLMPANWVIADLRQNRLSGLPDSVLSLPKKYRVSSEAFELRVASITPVSIVTMSGADGKIVIGRKFQSTQVAADLVTGAIHNVIQKLPLGAAPQRYYCTETRLMCVSKRVRADDFGRCWLVCVLPKAEVCPHRRFG